MGARLRLRGDYDLDGHPADVRVILEALQTYGMVLADNGSSWFLSGAPDENWDNDVLRALKDVPGGAFEVVDVADLQAEPDSGRVVDTTAADDLRLAGPTRIDTAVAISRHVFTTADAAVLARADDYPDALAAAPLAAALGGPVLLTARGALPGVVRDELVRLGVQSVHLAGGTTAVSTEVERAVRELVDDVIRHDGSDRFDTAARLAVAATDTWGGSSRSVLVALGFHPDPSRAWADALAGGAYGGRVHQGLLLVTPSGVPAATRRALVDRGVEHVTVLGGPVAISEDVVDDLFVGDVGHVGRIFGADRYETATRMAVGGRTDADVGELAIVATGVDWPDGLAAGAAVVRASGALLLTPPDRTSPHTVHLLEHHGFRDLRVAGGPAAVTDATVRALVAARDRHD